MKVVLFPSGFIFLSRQSDDEQERKMSVLKIATHPRSRFDAYRSNLGRAALDLLGALLASRFELLETTRKTVVTEDRRTGSANLKKLYRLAGNTDSVGAKVGAELSAIASRS
jgi:hypothetical protein